MSRFKEGLLQELTAYAQAVPASPEPRMRRLPRLAGALAGVVAFAAVATFAAVSTTSPAPAYAITKNPDGTVTITYHELRDAPEATRDLRAAGVRAQVVRLAHPGTCATSAEGEPVHIPSGVGAAYQILIPQSVVPDVDWSVFEADRNRLTIRPSLIPTGTVLFITISVSPGNPNMVGMTASVVKEPAPTCWEATNLVIFDQSTTAPPDPGVSPSPSR